MVVLVAICVKRHLKTISFIWFRLFFFGYHFGRLEYFGITRSSRASSFPCSGWSEGHAAARNHPEWDQRNHRNEGSRARNAGREWQGSRCGREPPATCHHLLWLAEIRFSYTTVAECCRNIISYCGSMGSKKQELAPNLHNLHVAWVQTIS